MPFLDRKRFVPKGGPMADSYGETVNYALLDFIGPLTGTVLDVGCGVGAWASHLRAAGATRLFGVESSADAERARRLYDEVFATSIADADLPTVPTVIAADILEHLVDPWAALRALREAAELHGWLFLSVPNMQFIKSLLTIARGHFPYRDGGFWDRTHLHWFTLNSLDGSLRAAGWRTVRSEFVVGGGRRRYLSAVTCHSVDHYLGHQIHVAAQAV